jgi:hypothetical protein
MSGLVMQAAMERLMLKHGLSLQTPTSCRCHRRPIIR